MSLYMETTEIPPERTIAEITRLLVDKGATGIASKYAAGQVAAVMFEMQIGGRPVPFKLPCRTEAVFKTLQSRRAPAYRRRSEALDQARAPRVAWRQMLRWVQAQMALVETGMVQIEEVFLPYLALQGGRTLYEKVAADQFLQLEDQR